jgi:hypothetical protein
LSDGTHIADRTSGQVVQTDNAWSLEVQSQQAQQRRPAARAPLTQEEEYKLWYDAVTKHNMPFEKIYELAQDYQASFGDKASFHNARELTAINKWLREQNERPAVELDFNPYLERHKAPTSEEVGVDIARSLGFSDGEMALYAAQHGAKTPGAAFYHCDGNNDELMQRAAKNPSHLVKIGDYNQGAIEEKRQWLKDYRASLLSNPIDSYDWEKERTLSEAVATHLLVPLAGAADSCLSSVGDIVQGVGLPFHMLYSRTFMDSTADWLRQRGQSLEMTGLYTDAEMNDAIVMLVNVYAHAGGSAAPYLIPGALGARFAGAAGAVGTFEAATDVTAATAAEMSMSARSLALASNLMGAAGNGGAVYDAAFTLQARNMALQEFGTRQPTEEELKHRIEEIKQGDGDPEKRKEIERKALIAAAFAAPMGVVQSRWLNELSTQMASGIAINALPESLILNVRNEMVKGGLIGAGIVITNETAQVIASAKTPQEAAQGINNNIGPATLGGVMIGATGGALSHRTQTTEESPPELETNKQQGQNSSEVPIEQSREPQGDTSSRRNIPSLTEPEQAAKLAEELRSITNEFQMDPDLAKVNSNAKRGRLVLDAQTQKLVRGMLAEFSDQEVEELEKHLNDPATMAKVLERAPELREQYEAYMKQSAQTEEANAKLHAILEPRREALQNKLDQYCDQHSLPRTKLQAEPDKEMKESIASYDSADGTIRIRESSLLRQGSGADEDLTSTIEHELLHAEQTNLVLRRFADEAHVGDQPTPEQIAEIKKRVHDTMAIDLSDEVLNSAMKLRAGKPLSQPEAQRADELARGFAEEEGVMSNYHKVERDIKMVQERSGAFQRKPQALLSMLSSGPMAKYECQLLFNSDHVPPEVQALINEQSQPGFDPNRINEVIQPLIKARLQQLQQDANQAHERYLNMRHEQEARSVENSISH